MNIKVFLLLSTIFCLFVENVFSSSEAVTECANVHHIPLSVLSSVTASYSNGKCTLKCVIGNATADNSFIHEGLPCPENSSGTCHQGQCVVELEDALKLCDHIHNVDAEKFPTSHASYSNSKCSLSCVIGHTTLQPEPIHEGQPCPEDTTGICRAGLCVGSLEDALHECGLKHHLDFHTLGNHKGTAFTNDQCMLRCELNGDIWSENPEHEGLSCPANSNGLCRNGTCVAGQSTNPGSTVTQPSIDSFIPSKMKLLNISLVSTDPSLNKNERIYLYFYETKQSSYRHICLFYGNHAQPNEYNPQTLSDIPHQLTKASQISIDFIDEDLERLTQQREDFFQLFENFYKNRKLAFGEHENFVTKIPIYGYYIPHEKLMDVTLRFTIVFE